MVTIINSGVWELRRSDVKGCHSCSSFRPRFRCGGYRQNEALPSKWGTLIKDALSPLDQNRHGPGHCYERYAVTSRLRLAGGVTRGTSTENLGFTGNLLVIFHGNRESLASYIVLEIKYPLNNNDAKVISANIPVINSTQFGAKCFEPVKVLQLNTNYGGKFAGPWKLGCWCATGTRIFKLCQVYVLEVVY